MANARPIVTAELWADGPSLGGFYQQGPRAAPAHDPRTHTLYAPRGLFFRFDIHVFFFFFLG